tara:strand:+ start:1860 stop:2231 length:372 start_codon:yes stop_codon:yes gene_type:complete
MSFVKDTLVDSDEHVVVKIIASGAVSRESILDVSGLSGGSSNSIVYIEEIQWSSAGLLTIDYDASTPQKVLELTGEGQMGGPRFPYIALPANTGASGFTGDIFATSAGSATAIIKFRKISGFS